MTNEQLQQVAKAGGIKISTDLEMRNDVKTDFDLGTTSKDGVWSSILLVRIEQGGCSDTVSFITPDSDFDEIAARKKMSALGISDF